ncbi:MAG: S8 family peptidase [Blautia sp.]|jgi:minor extracellular serine protease Vpr
MQDQKLDNQLNLAMDATEEERDKSLDLDVGYDPALRVWDVIVKYTGDIAALEGPGITVVPLLNEFAVVTLPQESLAEFSSRPEIEYVEKPKRLFFAVNQGKAASCAGLAVTEAYGVTGEGTLVGIVDSGIDYRHPDFQNADGTTRILALWDQTIEGRPPAGYRIGTEYTKEDIDLALQVPTRTEGERVVPSRDLSGHGTQVAGIAAGNGAQSQGVNKGMAWESGLVVVKLGNPREDSFPRTTELIQGIDYLIRMSLERNIPMAINLSFGNNYGSHLGDSLLESYLADVANLGRTVICVGTGNNARDALHTSGRVAQGEEIVVELGISSYESTLNLQLWKSYVDQMDIFLEHPSGQRIGPLYEELGPQRYYLGNTQLLIYYGKPSPYSVSQEIYMDFIPRDRYIDVGVWRIILRGRRIVQGGFQMWLPGGNVLNPQTGFYFPTPDLTLTIPATARRIVAVGAYNSRDDTYADFSGRGNGIGAFLMKPDLVAPGVDITTTKAGGGYTQATGTSFATPFVAGAAALLMEWGIVKGNDSFLYGEKVRAYLQRGARQLPGFTEFPNAEVGYGALCLRDSFPR